MGGLMAVEPREASPRLRARYAGSRTRGDSYAHEESVSFGSGVGRSLRGAVASRREPAGRARAREGV